MGQRNGPYEPDFPLGTVVQVVRRADLERFASEWHSHHPLETVQLSFAGQLARVSDIGFYHGGDELYTLQGIPGLWHEVCLRDATAIQNARATAAKIAEAVLAGQLSPVLGAIDLNGLRSSVDVPDNDPDFEAFMLIDSECEGLPIGSVRQHWSAEALTREEPEVTHAERWAMDTGGEAFRNVLSRFAPTA